MAPIHKINKRLSNALVEFFIEQQTMETGGQEEPELLIVAQSEPIVASPKTLPESPLKQGVFRGWTSTDSSTESDMDMSPITKSEIDLFIFKEEDDNAAGQMSPYTSCSINSSTSSSNSSCLSSSGPDQLRMPNASDFATTTTTTASDSSATPSSQRHRRPSRARKTQTGRKRLIPGTEAYEAALRDIDFSDVHTATVCLMDRMLDAKLIATLFLGGPPKMPQRLASLRVTSQQQDIVGDIVACVMHNARCSKREVFEALHAHSLAVRMRGKKA